MHHVIENNTKISELYLQDYNGGQNFERTSVCLLKKRFFAEKMTQILENEVLGE